MKPRYASIDIGTNTVLLLVAERREDGSFAPILELAEITRLGRGVDQSGVLSAQGMEDTLRVLTRFADQARQQGACEIAVSATSAARDAMNGAVFLEAARRQAGVEPEVISGDREAQLTFRAVYDDFGRDDPHRPLVMIDIGSVRLTERYFHTDPVAQSEWDALLGYLRSALDLPPAAPGFRFVGVAGTVTTLYAIQHRIEPYDANRVHGGKLFLRELEELSDRLRRMRLADRRSVPGLDPKRADVICAGAAILQTAMELMKVEECLVSDRGLRWGLLLDRFGAP
ncbi:MAG TPA: Ppx/GppA family phosphatase [Myxococcaceae bacterium]|nr:Ppx/GppA family phosphatase [Myxococcaceae bacterium]